MQIPRQPALPVASGQPEEPRPLVLHSRREFCAYACHAATLLAAGSLAACGGGGGSPSSPSSSSGSAPQLGSVSGTVNGRTISVTVDGASALAATGAAATVQTSLGTFLIARTGTDTFSALTAICTHEACTVSGFTAGQFVCPCHGSRFNTTGGVINGPATRPLQQYPTSFASGVLTFTV